MNIEDLSVPERSAATAALEESIVAHRAALAECYVQEAKTEEGTAYRILNKQNQPVSPVFWSKPCLDHYMHRMPLLTDEEWEKHPVQA